MKPYLRSIARLLGATSLLKAGVLFGISLTLLTPKHGVVALARGTKADATRYLPTEQVSNTTLGTRAVQSSSDAVSAQTSGQGVVLPAGTLLWLRLGTGISTITSHLHDPITARTIRRVNAGASVAIPLGATVRGRIDKLIPSSNPADRARLLLRFTSLELPDGSVVDLAGHVSEIDNARETVLPDGTVRGLLQSELPVSQLQVALEKLGKKDPATGGEIQKTAEKTLGKGSTAIEFPPGSDLTLALDKPLALPHLFSAAIPDQLDAAMLALVDQLLSKSPTRVQSKDGKPGDPLNLVMIGSSDQIQRAFQEGGWFRAEKKSDSSIWRTMQAIDRNAGYGAAPVSQLYLYGRSEDLAFEKMLNTFTKRHHLRLWRSPTAAVDGREIWLGAATHDTGIDLRPGVASHAIDPDLDAERAKVGADLEVTGLVHGEQLVARRNPVTRGLTATGATWKTDGRLLAVELKLGMQ
jgi:LssY C-terminus